MHNWYGIETEAEFRRQEWQRMVAAETRAAQAQANSAGSRGLRLPRFTLARLRALGASRVPFGTSLAPRRTAAYSSK